MAPLPLIAMLKRPQSRIMTSHPLICTNTKIKKCVFVCLNFDFGTFAGKINTRAISKLSKQHGHHLIIISVPKTKQQMHNFTREMDTVWANTNIYTHAHTHPLLYGKQNSTYQSTVTQHYVRGWGVSVCKVSGGWSCKDVNGGRHHASLVWQGRLLPPEDRGHSIKLDSNMEPKLSHDQASDKMNSLNNESIWDL